jgi:hypothetical protein
MIQAIVVATIVVTIAMLMKSESIRVLFVVFNCRYSNSLACQALRFSQSSQLGAATHEAVRTR